MAKYSTTYAGIVVLLLTSLLKNNGIEIGDEAVTNFVIVGGQIIGAILAAYGRYRLGGVGMFGNRV